MRILRAEELGRISVEEFKVRKKIPVEVVLDNIRSGLNVGSIFRTCDAFAIRHIYLCGITAVPPHKEILKAALGATESVSWSTHPDVVTSVALLKDKGMKVIGVEQTTESIPLQDAPVPAGAGQVLVFGNEVNGLSPEILPLLDAAIEVPQWGTKHSINVAVCAGIVLWHQFSRLL